MPVARSTSLGIHVGFAWSRFKVGDHVGVGWAEAAATGGRGSAGCATGAGRAAGTARAASPESLQALLRGYVVCPADCRLDEGLRAFLRAVLSDEWLPL